MIDITEIRFDHGFLWYLSFFIISVSGRDRCDIHRLPVKETEWEFSMDQERETLIKQSMRATIKLSCCLSFLLLCLVLVLCLLSMNKRFLFFAWISLLPLLHIVKRKAFFKKAQFCYGEITDVAPGDYDDICMSTKIEFKDNCSGKVYETWVYEHWGDYEEEMKEAIDEFYKNGMERIGKKVPLFYSPKNPNKTLAFIDTV